MLRQLLCALATVPEAVEMARVTGLSIHEVSQRIQNIVIKAAK